MMSELIEPEELRCMLIWAVVGTIFILWKFFQCLAESTKTALQTEKSLPYSKKGGIEPILKWAMWFQLGQINLFSFFSVTKGGDGLDCIAEAKRDQSKFVR